MPASYEREPHTTRTAAARFFTPSGLLPFVLAWLTVPFIAFDDILTRNPGYAGLHAINDRANIWAGFCAFLSVAGLLAWAYRSLPLQIVALLLQGGFLGAIALAILRAAPQSLGFAIYGSVALYGLLYAGWLVRVAVVERIDARG